VITSANPSFAETLARHDLALRRGTLRVLQLNLGKLCNQTCVHCHVGAGPGRREIMSAAVADRCIAWMRRHRPALVDLTGGAPELCPEFRRLALEARTLGARVLIRCNLTVIFEPGQEDLPEFYRTQELELICSLPCYSEANVDLQRGQGVFEKSIRALRAFNRLGYGREEHLRLDLVFNPFGPSLPPPQAALERAYRDKLRADFGIEFHALYCLANLPVTRFKTFLAARGELEGYHTLLLERFNPATVEGLMCRDTLNVGWEGDLFDCDFNQMVRLPLGGGERRFLWEVEPARLVGERIATGSHCFGCTAGSGSSCKGAIA